MKACLTEQGMGDGVACGSHCATCSFSIAVSKSANALLRESYPAQVVHVHFDEVVPGKRSLQAPAQLDDGEWGGRA